MDVIYEMSEAATPKKTVVVYHPQLREITGSINAAILLQQMAYWWKRNGNKPFYKFKEPCPHPAYKEGGSWCEELAFTRCEFDTASRLLVERGIISKKVTRDRLTRYKINQEFIERGHTNQWSNEAVAQSNTGFIYLINEVNGDHYKIGKSKNPKARIRAFGQLPFSVEIECLHLCENMHSAEEILHNYFCSFRKGGEWFALKESHVELLRSREFLEFIGIELSAQKGSL